MALSEGGLALLIEVVVGYDDNISSQFMDS